MKVEPGLLPVAKVCARSLAYTLYIVAARLAGMQATLPTVGRHATEGFLAHYPVHGELSIFLCVYLILTAHRRSSATKAYMYRRGTTLCGRRRHTLV